MINFNVLVYIEPKIQMKTQAQVAQEQRKVAESEKARAEQNESRANFAQTVANQNASKAKRSESRARQSAVAAKTSENRARIGETKALKSQREALAQKARADVSALAAQKSAAQANAAKDQEAAQRQLAEKRGKEFQAQKIVAERQTKVALEERARAEEQSRKLQIALAEGQLARRAAEQQKQAAVAQREIADKARAGAEDALEKLSDINRRRIERLRIEMARDQTDVAPAIEVANAFYDVASIYGEAEFREKSLTNYAEAAKAFAEVLNRKPGDYQSLAKRGFAYFKLKQYPEGIADFTACLDQRPQEVGHYLNRAQAYFDLNRFPDALRDLARVESLEPARMDHILRGRCLMEMRLYEQAVESFSEVLKHPNPTAASNGYVWIGDVRKAQGRYDDAYDAYTRYQELHVDNEAVYRARVDCRLAAKRWDDVIAMCNRYIQFFPNTGAMYPLHAYALLNKPGSYAAYRALCQEAVRRFGGSDATPENANSAAWTCALADNGLTDYTVPIGIARKAIAGAQKQIAAGTSYPPNDPLFALWNNRNTLAALLIRAGKYRDAIAEVEACEAMKRPFTTDHRFSDYVLFTLAYAGIGNRAEAERFLRETRALPTSLDIETRVEQQILLGEAIEAVNALETRNR